MLAFLIFVWSTSFYHFSGRGLAVFFWSACRFSGRCFYLFSGLGTHRQITLWADRLGVSGSDAVGVVWAWLGRGLGCGLACSVWSGLWWLAFWRGRSGVGVFGLGWLVVAVWGISLGIEP